MESTIRFKDLQSGATYRGERINDGDTRKVDDLTALALEAKGVAEILSDAERLYPTGDPDDSWRVRELTAYAADNNVSLEDATTKLEILARLRGE